MANLPSFRVGVAAPFTETGVDSLGPLMEKSGRQGRRVCVVVFICMRGRAVFLDFGTSIDGSSRRTKWLVERKPLGVGSLAWVMDDIQSRERWLLAVVSAAPLSDDGFRRLGFLRFLRFLGFLRFLRSNANGQRLERDIGEVVYLRRDGEKDGDSVGREVEVVKDSE